ncbi:MAG: PD-(D/E)XK nuclease family protein [Chloroflexi bacterium]|nr:PD-(D/E)XK nuclease family protein [Chloroflexota bacterium]
MHNQNLIRELESFVVNNPQLDQLERLIAEFNIFEAIGAVRQELRHSDFLSFMLNPAEKHGLDDRFLKAFLMRVLSVADEPPISPIRINVTNFSSATVERETQNVDILIHDADSSIVCIIENKIFTGEHSNQLTRYYQVAQRRYPGAGAIIPVFLTPDGVPPQDEDSPYIPLSYGDLAEIIEQVRQAQASMLGTDVNTIMRHYVTMLRRYIVSDSDIAELCQQIYRSHKAAIDLIIEHMPDLRQDLSDYLAYLVQNQAELILFRHTKSYVNCVLREWQEIQELNLGIGWSGSSASLSIEFVNGQDQLNLYLALGPVEDENQYIREILFEHASSNRDVFTGCRPKLYPKWSYLYKMPLLRRKDFEDASLDDLAQIIEPRWQHFLRDVLPQLHYHLMQIQFK